jgi:hypothetical protein
MWDVNAHNEPVCHECYEELPGYPEVEGVYVLGHWYCSLRCAAVNRVRPAVRRRMTVRLPYVTRAERKLCSKWAQVLTLGRVYR